MDEENQLKWHSLRLRPGLLERLHKEAQLRGLVPIKSKRGQDAAKLGAETLVEELLAEAEKKRKRKEGKGE